MDVRYLGWIEMVFSFGLVLAFCVWQLLDLRRLRREREAREREDDAG
jgi:hypothetical protein